LVACIRAARKELPDSVRFRFQVSGPFAALLKKELANEDVAVESTTGSADEHRSSLANCHLSLVSISPLGALAAFPSKTFSALAIGRPVLAICPRCSDLGKLLTQHDAGWVVSNSDAMREELPANEVANRFVDVLQQIAATPSRLAERSVQARRVFEEVGTRERLSEAWKDIVERVRR
jgi:glycosyltransferase involved in cell wall biosynthesis